MTDGKDAFAAMLRQAVMDFRFGVDGELKKPITYVAASNGLFEVRQNAIGVFSRKVDGVPDMGEVAEGFRWGLPKIPWALFEQAVAFFKAVMKRHGGAEAYIQLFFDKTEGTYFAHVPKQYVSGGHVSFDRDVELEAKHILVMEAHSHNTMSAFFSGTDNADEQADRLFMVMGKLDERAPQVLVRCAMGGQHVPLTIEETFEVPADNVPQSWLDQVNPPRQEAVAGRTTSGSLNLGYASRSEQGVLFDGGEIRGADHQGTREGGDHAGDDAVHAGAAGSPPAEDPGDWLWRDGRLGDSALGAADQEPGCGEPDDRGWGRGRSQESDPPKLRGVRCG